MIAGPRCATLAHAPDPDPGPSDVRVRILGVGLCGSNLPVWEGRPWFHYPFSPGAPGHEPWGEIDRVGRDVHRWQPGDRVAFLHDQAFAQLAVTPATDAVALPSSLNDARFPGEAIACAVNVIDRSALSTGERVAIVGTGFLGAIAVALARRAGARVTAASRRTTALDAAHRMGAHEILTLDDLQSDAGQRLRESFDCVIEAAGDQRTLDLASSLVRERGRLVIAGYHQDGTRCVDMQSWNWRGIDVINAHERARARYLSALRSAVDLVATGALDPTPLYTHEFPLADLDRAFATAVTRPDGFMKAIVRP